MTDKDSENQREARETAYNNARKAYRRYIVNDGQHKRDAKRAAQLLHDYFTAYAGVIGADGFNGERPSDVGDFVDVANDASEFGDVFQSVRPGEASEDDFSLEQGYDASDLFKGMIDDANEETPFTPQDYAGGLAKLTDPDALYYIGQDEPGDVHIADADDVSEWLANADDELENR